MKIGIVTQPLSRNYGGILQNYALQQTLIKLGHTPYTFDLGKYTWRDWLIATIKYHIKCIIGKAYKSPETPMKRTQQEKILRSFVEKNITLIKPRTKRLSVKPIFKNNLEAIIVGSDQVWRPKYNYCIEDMYLDFAKDLNIKRIAYAASFGTDEWEYTDKQTEVCKILAKKFCAISVREKSGEDLCKKHLETEAVHMIDPTLLLTVNEYQKLLTHIPVSKSKYLFVYMLDQTDEKMEYVKRYAENLGLEVVIKGADTNLSEGDSIENWLVNFRDAKYIITDSFHGSVFSIIFNKPFIALGNRLRGMERFNTLLSMYGLEKCLIDSMKSEIDSFVNPEWSLINAISNTYRETAIKFLTKKL